MKNHHTHTGCVDIRPPVGSWHKHTQAHCRTNNILSRLYLINLRASALPVSRTQQEKACGCCSGCSSRSAALHSKSATAQQQQRLHERRVGSVLDVVDRGIAVGKARLHVVELCHCPVHLYKSKGEMKDKSSGSGSRSKIQRVSTTADLSKNMSQRP